MKISKYVIIEETGNLDFMIYIPERTGIMIKANITNLKEFSIRSKEVDKIVKKRAKDTIGKDKAKKIGQKIYNRSQKYCPLDTGRLKKSGKLKILKNRVKIQYTAPHAFFAHESNSVKTIKNPNARTQFLRRAMNEIINEEQVK